jgi:hypothetical protein
MTRSALETVTLYIERIWNEGRDDLIPSLCADPIVRHDPNALTALSHAEQRARIRHNYDELRPVFTWEVLAGDDRHVTLVWNVTGRDPGWALCGIEIFRVEGGVITEVWNLPYAEGRWGQDRILAGRTEAGAAMAFPIVSAELGTEGGEMVVPVDAVHVARWLRHLLGRPESRDLGGGRWEHRFAASDAALPEPLALTLAERGRPDVMMAPATVMRMALALAPNGLVNATVAVTGSSSPGGEGGAPAPAEKAIRLSRTTGRWERDGRVIGTVVDGAVAFGAAGTDASGRITIRLADGGAEAAAGAGRLTVGWEEGANALLFEADAELVATARAFSDDEGTDVVFTWRASGLRATLLNDRPA